MDYDFRLEKTLRARDKDLHTRFTNTVFALQNILSRYKLLFPEYTNHSEFHCLNVIQFCNILIGSEQLEKLNADELYVLLMSSYLHDSGMAISQKDYEEFKVNLDWEKYFELNPSREISDFVRDYHNEFSGMFIKKYSELLDIPTPEHIFAVIQVSRGHRRTNLYNISEYPPDFMLQNGNTVCLPYLSALIRLSDEVDVIATRNPKLLYDIQSLTDAKQIMCNKLLAAVPNMEILPDSFVLYVNNTDPVVAIMIEHMIEKMQATLDLCRAVTQEHTKFRITQERIDVKVI